MEINGISEDVFVQYEIIRKSGMTNMYNKTEVLRIAKLMDLDDLAEFMEANDSNYSLILKNYSAAKEAGII